eukprot:7310091-Prorocentrum_lima.AAC.1
MAVQSFRGELQLVPGTHQQEAAIQPRLAYVEKGATETRCLGPARGNLQDRQPPLDALLLRVACG